MDRAAVLAAVIHALHEAHYSSDIVIREDMTLESLGLDSLDVLEIVFELEDKLDVSVKDGEVLLRTTVGELTDLFAAKKARKCRAK